MLSLGRIVISHLVVADLFMHSLSDMILLYLVMPFFTLKMKVFLHEIYLTDLDLLKSTMFYLLPYKIFLDFPKKAC